MDNTIQTGAAAPDFRLDDLDGNAHSLGEWRGRVTVLYFWSAECPWVAAADQSLKVVRAEWGPDVVLVPVASNASEADAELQHAATERGLPFVLDDRQGQVAARYGAHTTPHVFVIDREGVLRYQGAFNDRTFRQREVRQEYLRQAVAALLAGQAPEPAETPPYGCAIVRHAP